MEIVTIVLGPVSVDEIKLKCENVSEISSRLISNRTPFVSTVRSMKAPEKPALIDSHDEKF